MDLAFSEEQEIFRSGLQSLLAQRQDRAAGHDIGRIGVDADLWELLCGQLALPGLHIPETWDGSGFSLLETAIAIQEVGRRLARVPLLPTAMASEAILRLGDEDQGASLLPGMASGGVVGTVAEYDPAGMVTEEGEQLFGQVRHVMHGGDADLLVLLASDRSSAHVVVLDQPGVEVSPCRSLDETRPVAHVELLGARAARLPATKSSIDLVAAVGRVLLAFDALGGAEACLSDAVDYAGQRHQFNRPIGSFQAVKHRCAEMAIELDVAASATMYAGMLAASRSDEVEQASYLALAQANDTYVLCAETSLQVHGGIGFTWEHPCHRYLKRARTLAVAMGTSAGMRRTLFAKSTT